MTENVMAIVGTTWPAASARDNGIDPAEPRSRHVPEPSGEGGDAMPAAAFAALLEAARLPVDHGPASAHKALAAQMFEPDIQNARQGRRDALEQEYRASSLSSGNDDRLDATSVRARRAMHENHAGDGDRYPPCDVVDWSSPRGEDRKPLALVNEAASLTRRHPDRSGAASTGVDRGAAGTQATRSGPEAATQVASPARGNTEAGPTGLQAADGPLPMAPTGAPVPSSGRPGGGVAHQVAQILGASPAGEVESARAPAPASTPQQARSRAQDRNSADKATPNARSGGKTPSSPSTETDPTTRPAFDRLVRSIRLRTSARQSSARLHLHPPELGRVLVNVRMSGDDLQIDVRTETAEARELLHERVSRLRAALELHGIQVGRFEVTGGFPGDHPDAGVGADGFQPAGGEGKGYRRTDSAWSSGRELGNDAAVSDGGDGGFEAVVVGERRLDVRV